MYTAKRIITDFSPEYQKTLEAKFDRIWDSATNTLERAVSTDEKEFMKQYAHNSSQLRHMFKIIGKEYCPTECEVPCCNGAPHYLGANDLLVRLQKTEGNATPILTLDSLEDCYKPCEYNNNGCQLDLFSSTRCLGFLCSGLISHYKGMDPLGEELVNELGSLKDLWVGEDDSKTILRHMSNAIEVGTEIIYKTEIGNTNPQ